jgi:SAM-dependent methyltransferase
MRSALINNAPARPNKWQDLPLGEDIKSIVEASIAEVTRKFFGYHLVRLGDLSSQLELANCPIYHKINITAELRTHTGLVAQSTSLPISENSVDAFILAHELDFAKDPHQILREVDRTIMPNGYVLLTGFNPLSVCGLFKYLPFNKENVLHQARFFSSARVKDWLQLLGFEVIDVKYLLLNELFLQRKLRPNSTWNQWSQKYLSLLSSMYIIVAQKRELPMSLIKPKWKTASKTKFSPLSAARDSTVL